MERRGPRDIFRQKKKKKKTERDNRKKEIKEAVIMACKHDDEDRR
jgi:hypothetical protein